LLARSRGLSQSDAIEPLACGADERVEAFALEKFHHENSARHKPFVGELERQLGKVHTPGLIRRRNTADIGGHIRQYKIDFCTDRGFQARENVGFAKIPVNALDALERVHRQYIERHNAPLDPHTFGGHLRPTARRRTKIHDLLPALQKAITLVELDQLERCASPVASAASLLDVRIGGLSRQPAVGTHTGIKLFIIIIIAFRRTGLIGASIDDIINRLRNPEFTMSLKNNQIRKLRGLCHTLSPVVMVADKGLSENVQAEIETALDNHELIKVKLRGEREQRTAWIEQILADTSAELVQKIGQVACFYRPNPKDPKISAQQISD